MKKQIFIKLMIMAILLSTFFSCVPSRRMEDVKAENDRYLNERNNLKRENETLSSENNELNSNIKKLRAALDALIADTTMKGKSYQALNLQYEKINELYEQLLANQEKLRKGADADAEEALSLLQQTRTELQRKEDELRALESSLNKERANLEDMRIQIGLKEKEIAEKNAKVAELQAILNAQDSIMKALRQKISDALVGFEGEGLTVYMKDGNVYVSLDEKLLFQSGKWDVDPKGVQALKNLANVLENNPDINILIEGHTDNVPYGGSGNIQDNWDLSVKRATAIVKILLSNSNIEPSRLTAAGRGQYIPIDSANTTEARAKNRRTEIILTPKLNTLYDIVNQ
ncbi:MAG: OmpA family protein [Bacteroidales bacterium]|jgi:chemotaxis protein MotB|nr:OmpA family protein [Bacteroidales bacterium]